MSFKLIAEIYNQSTRSTGPPIRTSTSDFAFMEIGDGEIENGRGAEAGFDEISKGATAREIPFSALQLFRDTNTRGGGSGVGPSTCHHNVTFSMVNGLMIDQCSFLSM